MIQTVDFFTPIVDDPFVFGQIAAANALSDVYAMGGRPVCALNIVAFPIKTLPMEVLHDVLRGGLSKLREAEAVLAGGHSIEDDELKYGMSVSGLVHPQRIWTNRGARPGDRLVLTKPVGTGVVATALKRGRAAAGEVEAIVESMRALNRTACEALLESGAEVHACTDVTGFGLVGHAHEMLEGSDLGLTLRADSVPLFEGALEHAAQGAIPGGLRRNMKHHADVVTADRGVEPALLDLLHDPQTSGGLLVALPVDDAKRAVESMHERGIEAAEVGELTAGTPGRILVKR